MNRSTKLLMTLSLMMTASVAIAHPGHGVHTHNDFLSGLMHPLMGIDHLLAMAAIGFWSMRQCNDPALSAHITPLTHRLVRVFSSATPDVGVYGYKSESNH